MIKDTYFVMITALHSVKFIDCKNMHARLCISDQQR